ncbi:MULTISPECIES: zinc finger protein [unclassified Crossiella]|uniref:zinc finger protein n=1 Tax=unclassified Crossiella TaxID=2620835 RepID=UPI001FFEC21D|nr:MULTISPECIES: zinc finger protein [unclassified Crossiella]MCK2243627.1 hypothetical protein [Crossiella sp. S99.2]MCK2257485.1 hypothetical protein [Crossiella sp. S99.1]
MTIAPEPGPPTALGDPGALDEPIGFGNPTPEQLLFYWMPVDGRRHAICGAHGSHRPGQPADTLCGRQVVTRTASEREWILWTTCDECWHIAKSAQHAGSHR